MNSVIGTRIANEIGVPILIDAPKSGLALGPFVMPRTPKGPKNEKDISKVPIDFSFLIIQSK